MNVFLSPKAWRSWKLIFFRISKHEFHALNVHTSSVGGKWKILWSLIEFLSFSCLQITLHLHEKQQISMWEAVKSTAKHYPRIHPAGKAFRQPPFCLTMLFHHILNTRLLLPLLLFLITSTEFRIGNREIKYAGVILLNFIFFFFVGFLCKGLQFILFYENFQLRMSESWSAL